MGFYGKGGDLTPMYHDWVRRFIAQGYVVLLPDSFTARGFDEICTRDQKAVRASQERVGDAYAALAFLETLPFVRGDRVAVVGWSNGGTTALSMVAHTSPARPLALAADVRVSIAFYPRCLSVLNRSDWMPPVAPLHVLIGEKDDWSAAAPCEELAARAREVGAPVETVVYPGAYHAFDQPSMAVHVVGNIVGTPSHTATIGQDPAARSDAILRVTKVLASALNE